MGLGRGREQPVRSAPPGATVISPVLQGRELCLPHFHEAPPGATGACHRRFLPPLAGLENVGRACVPGTEVPG
jgi:hypothetical protein